MKFLCDQMLGTLAKWLRLFGFDTFYANAEMDDEELLRVADEENRILITRDKQLIVRAIKKNLQIVEMTLTDIDEQLKRVLKDIKKYFHPVYSERSER